MKLSRAELARFIARPDAGRAGILLFGPDPMRVALRRQALLAALTGPEAEAEMRLTRLAAGALRADPAALSDALRARGFFEGPRAVFLDEAGDAAAKPIAPLLDEWQPGDATLVVAAGALPARSALRKLFEGHPNALAAGIYDDPPDRAEIAAMLAAAGLGELPGPAMAELAALAARLDPGELAQTIEKLALYTAGQTAPPGPDDVAACAPVSVAAAPDELIAAVAEGRRGAIGPILRRLEAQGVDPVTITIAATRHFMALQASTRHPDGASAGVAALRPPVHFRVRDGLLAQVRRWSSARLDRALAMLIETDLALRSNAPVPRMALVERCLIRLAMLAGARQG